VFGSEDGMGRDGAIPDSMVFGRNKNGTDIYRSYLRLNSFREI
jgi:hypothetical protein